MKLLHHEDMLLALLAGKEVEFWNDSTNQFELFQVGSHRLDMFHQPERKFRLKPEIVKFEIELPKPFKPKVGDKYYYLDVRSLTGYNCDWFDDAVSDMQNIMYGAWKEKSDIESVVQIYQNVFNGDELTKLTTKLGE